MTVHQKDARFAKTVGKNLKKMDALIKMNVRLTMFVNRINIVLIRQAVSNAKVHRAFVIFLFVMHFIFHLLTMFFGLNEPLTPLKK